MPKPYLEFGSKEGGDKTPYDQREGQEAYDFFMIARYFKDIISYRKGKVEDVHHKVDVDDTIRKYTAFKVCKALNKPMVYYEVGSSLMGVIDALQYINKIRNELKVKEIKFVGVDNSDMMNEGAKIIYADKYQLELYKTIEVVECGLFFCKGVSILYAFSDEKLFCDVIKKAAICVFDYTFSKGEAIPDFIGSGKKVTFLGLPECRRLLEVPGKKLVLNPSERINNTPADRVTHEVIYGDEEVVDQYIKVLEKEGLT